jgi:hypothetical protein
MANATVIRRSAGVLLAAALTIPALAIGLGGVAAANVSVASPGASIPYLPELTGVSCPDRDNCLAVGDVDINSGLAFPVADHWNGSSWKLLHPLIPAGAVDSFLTAVSCSGVGACTATGYWVDEAFVWHTLAERWGGTGWTIQATSTTGMEQDFTGVSCPTASACIAVGDHFVETWDGSSWALQRLPLSANGVSCPTSTFCMAVGKLAASWNGTTWTHDPPVFPADSSSAYLTSVSCSTPSFCLATGTYIAALPTGSALKVVADAWDGHSWKLVSPDAVSSFDAVSCPSTRVCMAVGTADSGTLAQSWRGATWTSLDPINPSGVSDSLFGVSCATPDACSAVGVTSTGTVSNTLAEQWDGNAWHVEATPRPPPPSSPAAAPAQRSERPDTAT